MRLFIFVLTLVVCGWWGWFVAVTIEPGFLGVVIALGGGILIGAAGRMLATFVMSLERGNVVSGD